ncbi:bacterio-opsin activator HTH domain-containing protein [Halalkaliarchaeum desulfuricum]|uniref:Bacterio-opsin activator HTH domain-containing protein n=1 Tax=Halalkaliarchaeum desulfuricum TaxID=2055893 RepID=A0A343TMS8_9EURY|nr:helix-turn-helix domain-containing protein [Halalkaliarchaeum desulfuricum]AUX10400.1 bacterio-opsin activator HTH domain-containing protein [Halalkaliarchaeum desulfuricum]
MSGVRARLSIREPPNCPVAASLEGGTTATAVEWTAGMDPVTEQFKAPTELDLEADFEANGQSVYRVEREDTTDCPCSVIESCGHPVSEVEVRSNPSELVVTIHLPSPEPLEEIIDAIESTGSETELRYLVRTKTKGGADPIVVDRTRLTSRQREVLETAHRLGYFEYPRETNAEGVAEEIGIARSTFAEHLAAAQSTLVENVLGDG